MGLGFAGPLAGQDFAPPLKADFAKRRLADEAAHAPDFEAEGIKRLHKGPPLGWQKKRRQPAVFVFPLEQLFASGIRVRGHAHGTASKAAATRRSSAKRME